MIVLLGRATSLTVEIEGVTVAQLTNVTLEIEGSPVTVPGGAGSSELTPIPLSAAASGYTLNLDDSQPIVPPGTHYQVNVSCQSPHGAATFRYSPTPTSEAGIVVESVINDAPGWIDIYGDLVSSIYWIDIYVPPDTTPGTYTCTVAATISDNQAIGGAILATQAVSIGFTITVGPAWPPPQLLTSDGTITLSTDNYAYSITAGDSIDIEIYEATAAGFTGTDQFFLSEQSPENIIGTTPQFGTFWCIFPSNASGDVVTAPPNTPTLITTAKLQTTLLTPPGLYAFTISDNMPTPNPAYESLAQTGTPTNTGQFSLYLGSTPIIEGTPPYIFCHVYITGIGEWFDWVTLSIDTPTPVGTINPGANPSMGGWGLEITPTPGLAPGDYLINLTGTNGSHTATLQLTLTINNTSSPFEGINSASINVQVLSAGSQAATSTGSSLSGALALRSNAPAGSRSGIIAHNWRGLQVLRAKTMPVNPNSPSQTASRARHLSRVAAILANTIDQAETWAVAAAAFPGNKLIPADIFDGVTAMTTFLQMTPAQFQYLCQSTQQNFGQLVTLLPAVNLLTIAYATAQTTTTLGPYTLTMPATSGPWSTGMAAQIMGGLTPNTGTPAAITATFTGAGSENMNLSLGAFDFFNIELYIQPNLNCDPGTYSLTATINYDGTDYAFPFTVTVAIGDPPTAAPNPWFPQAMGASTNSVYDQNYQCIGFVLGYTYLPYGTNFGGYGTSGINPNSWIISATNANATSVTSKSSSGYVVLGYYVNPPTPTQLLADWLAVYGTLPTSGTIYFSIQPADPIYGVTGMAMTAGLSYKNGTLHGFIRPAAGDTYATSPNKWFGPLFSFVGNVGGGYIQGIPALGGGGWTEGDPYEGTITFKFKIKKGYPALPPGVIITTDVTEIVIASSDTTLYHVGTVFTVPSDQPGVNTILEIEATDGKSTKTYTTNPWILTPGPMVPNGLSLTPNCPLPTVARSSNTTVYFTLDDWTGTGLPYTVSVSDIATGITGTSSAGTVTPTIGTPPAPGAATFHVTISAASCAAPGQYLFEVSCGNGVSTIGIWGQITIT